MGKIKLKELILKNLESNEFDSVEELAKHLKSTYSLHQEIYYVKKRVRHYRDKLGVSLTDTSSDVSIESPMSDIQGGYESQSVSAIDENGNWLSIEDWCKKTNQNFARYKSHKQITHTGIPRYNVFFKSEEEYQRGLELEDKVKLFIEERNKIFGSASKLSVNKSKKKVGSPIMASLADLHIGGKADKSSYVMKTKDFSLDIVKERLHSAVDMINKQGSSEVHLSLVGDLVESILGLNHLDSYDHIDSNATKSRLFKIVEDLLVDAFSKIVNLKKIYMVSGNHDRLSNNKAEDPIGTGAYIISTFLRLSGFDVEYHPALLSVEVDNIRYIITHGHLNFAKNIPNLILNYGDQNKYNVVMSGHLHTRSSTKANKLVKVEDDIIIDSSFYRAVKVAPVFTGNYYSETLGYTSSAGMSIFESTTKGDNVHHYDLAI